MTPREERMRGLGRGLSALIGEEAVPTRGEAAKATRTLPIAFLKPGRFQPRKNFADDALADLAASVKEKGVLTPILVRPLGPDAYEIVAGERRWRAAQMAKLHDVPVVVRELADAEALEIAIIENVQRADLNAIEEAGAYQELIERFGRTQEQVAQDVGKSRSHVANTLRLLRLPEFGEDADPGRKAHRRPCSNAVKRTGSRGGGVGHPLWKDDGAPGRTTFGEKEEVRCKTAQGPQYRRPRVQAFQWLRVEGADCPQRG